MQAIILAAGKGTRLGRLTQNTPKSLIKIKGQPLLKYTLSSLPSSIKEVIIVTGHLGEKIREEFGTSYNNLPIKYVTLAHLLGTAYSLWQTRPLIKEGKFMVLNGDDIYNKKELETMLEDKWSFGLIKSLPPRSSYLTFELNKNGHIQSARYPTESELEKGILLATGAYVLDHNIFKYEPVKISNGEYGLPQTILSAVKKHPTKGVIMKKWLQINYPEDVAKAEKNIKSKL